MSGIMMLLLAGVKKAAAAVDPYFNYVTALLHGDGTNGGQNNTFLDSSTNNFTITRNGNTTQGSFSPFSQTGWGNYSSGNGADYLSLPSSASWAFGTGDFTIECWLYYPSTQYDTVTNHICGNNVSGNDATWGWSISATTKKLGLSNWNYVLLSGNTAIPTDQWVHLVCLRESGTLKFYINGTLDNSAANATNFSTSASLTIFRTAYTSLRGLTGYISNFRIVKGTAVYTGNFTPSTAPLTAVSGTELLTCQSNRFVDNSSNDYAVTANGNVSVQAFSPFNPTTAYSTSAVGGSGYFDGSGDYLGMTTAAGLQLSSTDTFTIEFWWYPTSLAAQQYVQSAWSVGSNGYAIATGVASLTAAELGFFDGTTWRKIGNPVLNAWNHVAIVSSGTSNTGYLYLNGVPSSAFTVASTINYTSGSWYAGWAATGVQYLNGYLSGFRLVKGTNLYPSGSSFTPPTAPLTAISGTSLLLNFTNGAIYDNAAVADYETVGNAQISTSVVKYGTGSIAFDGNGDVLSAPDNELIRLSSGDFTIECWVYPTANGALYDSGFASYGAPSTLAGWFFGMSGTNTGGTLNRLIWSVNYAVSGGAPVYGNAGLSLNTWSHVAVVKIGTTINLFINGNLDKSATVTATPTTSSSYKLYVGAASYDPTGTQRSLTGYIDDLRITKGVGRYPYNFTPPDAELPNIGGTITLTADPYYEYTTLLLPGNGTNGAQNNTFVDSSTNNFTITRNGNTTQGTFSPFSQTGWSNYFDGSGDYLSAPSNTALEILGGSFTIEFWMCMTSAQGNYGLVSKYGSGTGHGWLIRLDTTFIRWYTTATSNLDRTYSFAVGTWYHIAVVSNGTTGTIYINGTAQGATFSTNGTQDTSTTVQIGRTHSLTNDFPGYISNLRIVKGTAVYTANFTPPTSALTAITNTSLLTCQSNRFIDNSSNAFAITRNGGVDAEAFSPFNPTASWSAATNGGSGYFDGSGDYLTVPDNAAFDFGSGDFTISAWVYPQGAGGIIDQGGGGASSNRSFEIYMSNASTISNAYISSDGTYQAGYNLTGTTVPNAWNFIEFTRSSGTLRLFVNGVQQSSVSANVTIFNSTATVAIGNTSANAVNPYTGYISDVRVLKGTGSATSTVPTSPLTAVTNTQLLCNFTNGGIYDATSKNDLETVGNAQISTTQSKFGGSSMYFDGTGDYLLSPSSVNWDFGTGDFTVEFWINFSSVGNDTIVGKWGSGIYAWVVQVTSSNLIFYTGNNGSLGTQYTFAWTASTGIWYHVAVTRYGTSLKAFIDGSQIGSTQTNSHSLSASGAFCCIGENLDGGGQGGFVNGYINDLRITKGIARYTSNFTPPSTAFLTL